MRLQPDDSMVWFGSSVKALDDSGRIGGHLILFGSPEATDATAERDYFTAATKFWTRFPTERPVLYHHGLDPTLQDRELGDAFLKVDDAGVWLEAQLSLRDDYERRILEAIKAGRLGWSSGSTPHLIRRERQKNGAQKILSWPIVEASITPTPGEPRATAVALKSLMVGSVKGAFLGPDAERVAALGAVDRLFDRARWRLDEILRDQNRTESQRLDDSRSLLSELSGIALRLLEIGASTPTDTAAIKALIDGLGSGAPPELFLDTCLRTASELEQAAGKFAKVGPTKLGAIKALRDALGTLAARFEPTAVDPERIAAGKRRLDEVLSRLGSIRS